MNKSDSERISAVFKKNGYKETNNLEKANFLIINMCSVRQSAVDRVYGLLPKIKKLKKEKKKFKSILTGCILKQDLKKFKEYFDFILTIKSLPFWKKLLKKDKYFYYPDLRKDPLIKKIDDRYLKIKPNYSDKISCFVPISNGCNNFCSFCVVPFTRGPLISRPHKDIITEIKDLVKNKVKEIWLLGQNVNDYISPSNKSIDFSSLLELISNIKGEFWLRFTSPNPKNFTKKSIEKIAKLKKITPYLNLPLQSGDNEILKRMRRPYSVFEYKKKVKEIREAFKKYKNEEVALSTDIIVGFPGETKKNFENTLKVVKEIEFDTAFVAKYSPRPNTLAKIKYKDDVSSIEKERRYKKLNKLVEKIALKKNKKLKDKILDVLITKKIDNSFFIGKTKQNKTVRIKNNKIKKKILGKILKVKIKKIEPFRLEGQIVK